MERRQRLEEFSGLKPRQWIVPKRDRIGKTFEAARLRLAEEEAFLFSGVNGREQLKGVQFLAARIAAALCAGRSSKSVKIVLELCAVIPSPEGRDSRLPKSSAS